MPSVHLRSVPPDGDLAQGSEHLKHAAHDHPIHPLLASRWSPRSFDGTPIADDELLSVFEAARWAASANNRQPWHFTVGRRGDALHRRILECLSPRNAGWAHSASALVLTSTATDALADGSVDPYAWHDLGQAVAVLITQATELGLHAHQMAGFDRDAARLLLDPAPDREAATVIALGRVGAASAIADEAQRELETAARTRKALHTIVTDIDGPLAAARLTSESPHSTHRS